MLVAISGGRPDGTPWPAAGEIIEVGDAEGAELCRSDPHHDKPMAVPVYEERAETAVPKSDPPEVRAEDEDEEVSVPKRSGSRTPVSKPK